MNFVQKYRLYKKIMQLAPEVSAPMFNSTAIYKHYRWGFNVDEKSYYADAFKMIFSTGATYMVKVHRNNTKELVTEFVEGRMAKKIFEKIDSVSLVPIMTVKVDMKGNQR